jgi:hypothetical protein
MKGLSKYPTHGGVSLRGMASPSFTHGKSSRYIMPERGKASLAGIVRGDHLKDTALGLIG